MQSCLEETQLAYEVPMEMHTSPEQGNMSKTLPDPIGSLHSRPWDPRESQCRPLTCSFDVRRDKKYIHVMIHLKNSEINIPGGGEGHD